MIFDLQLFAEDGVIPTIVDHAEEIGRHAERLDVLGAGQEAITGTLASFQSGVDEIGKRLDRIETTQFETAQKLEELKPAQAVQEETESLGGAAPEVAPPARVPAENQKRKTFLGRFHETIG